MNQRHNEAALREAALNAAEHQRDTAQARVTALEGALRNVQAELTETPILDAVSLRIIKAALAAAPREDAAIDPSACDHAVSCPKCGTRWPPAVEVRDTLGRFAKEAHADGPA